ncbi:unnamed protein product [Allacma fusca]|uniref:Uncharacterized protein n=1 Tax=Allacma fusca TaxID=39272 RepID=A0A8J2KDW6_9HEXA|nr:unnamed protein product [Allacma fusca]
MRAFTITVKSHLTLKRPELKEPICPPSSSNSCRGSPDSIKFVTKNRNKIFGISFPGGVFLVVGESNQIITPALIMSSMIRFSFVFLLISQMSRVMGQFGPDDNETNDGMLGIVPEMFDEDSEVNKNIYTEDKVTEFLAQCNDIQTCENCSIAFSNSHSLQNKSGTCDRLSIYAFDKLKLTQYHIKSKKSIVTDHAGAGYYLFAYMICLILGLYLLFVRHFRLKTLWDSYAHDPTQGMRSFRYERMLFKFDYQDPGANPEDMTRYEDWDVYHSSEDEDVDKHYNAMGAIGPEQAMLKKKKEAEQAKRAIKGSLIWPWNETSYDFSKVSYREGLRRDLDDFKDDDDIHFTSSI